MQIQCRSCRAPIVAEDMNIALAVAKCRQCNSVFGFADEVTGARRPRGPVELPVRFAVEDLGATWRIVRRWFTPVAFFLVFFCMFWDGIVLVFITTAFFSGEPMMALFTSLHAAVGLGLTYFTVCSFVNRTIIEIAGDRLRVRHTPLPWPGRRDLAAADVRQLFTTEKVHRGKNGVSYSYVVHVRTSAGGDVKLLAGLSEVEHALFVEQQIEQRLGIRDEPVAGEVAR